MNISRSIIDERDENGPFLSFIDAVIRLDSVGCNKNWFESLIKCGAFDTFPGNRNQKIHMYPKIIDDFKIKNIRSIDRNEYL